MDISNTFIDYQHIKSIVNLVGTQKFNIEVYKYLDSTNNYLVKKGSIQNCQTIDVAVAEYQTSGRGRYGRSWLSGPNEGLTFSLSRIFRLDLVTLHGLSLVIGIAIIRVLNSFGIVEVGLKWPNDIVSTVSLKKIAGILIDIHQLSSCESRVVIGIGINFNLSSNTKRLIQQSVTDLFSLVDFKLNRNVFLGNLLIELNQILNSFENLGFLAFRDEWIKYHLYEGKEVKLIHGISNNIYGLVDGVGDDGAISLITDGKKNFYHIGEFSLLPVDDCT